jgi:hypothetical protein
MCGTCHEGVAIPLSVLTFVASRRTFPENCCCRGRTFSTRTAVRIRQDTFAAWIAFSLWRWTERVGRCIDNLRRKADTTSAWPRNCVAVIVGRRGRQTDWPMGITRSPHRGRLVVAETDTAEVLRPEDGAVKRSFQVFGDGGRSLPEG